MKEFIGQKIKRLRKATKEEMEDVLEEGDEEPLLVYDLENGTKLYCITDQVEDEPITVMEITNENGEKEVVEVDTK